MASSQQQGIRGKYFGQKLKAKKVIELYQAGERNFQGVKLRGQSFKGQDLSGADFSEADIRSADFTGANFTHANFGGVSCGLQKRWAIPLIILSCSLSGMLSGLLSISTGLLVSRILYSNSVDYYAQILSLIGLIVLFTFSILSIFYGISVRAISTVGTMAISVLILILTLLLLGGEKIAAIVGAEAISVVGVVVGAVLISILATVLVTIASTVSGVSAPIVTIVISVVTSKLLVEKATNAVAWVFGGLSAVNQTSVPGTLLTYVLAIFLAVASIYSGWRASKDYEKYTWVNSFAIAVVALKGTSFKNTNLTNANFAVAKLKSTDFRKANLSLIRWHSAKMLDYVRPGKTYLKNIQLRHWLVGQGKNKNFDGQDLRGVNLHGANLVNASFIGTELGEASLSEANLTGACIEDWNINSETNLENVICDYIYLKEGQQERRPSDHNRNFEPGDFARLVQKSVETVDLIFKKGVDWRAVAYSIKNTQVLNKDTPLAIQSIENKGNGVVLIKVTVPQNANKGKIEGDFWQGYDFANKTLKEQYEARLLDKDKFINKQSQQINQLFYSLNQAQEKLGEVPKLMAEQPKNQQNFNAPVYGVAGNVEGDMHVNASEQKQTLAQAAEEIQNLLKQLEKTNPSATKEEKIIYVNDETSPGLKRRTVSALKAGVGTSIEEFLDNPYINVGKAVVEGWLKPE